MKSFVRIRMIFEGADAKELKVTWTLSFVSLSNFVSLNAPRWR